MSPADWATRARHEARGRLASLGWPEAGVEYWKFTRPDDFVRAARARIEGDMPRTGDSSVGLPSDLVGQLADAAIAVHDLADATSHESLAPRCTVAPLADLLATGDSWAAGCYGALEAASHAHVPKPLASFNTGHAANGYGVQATGPTEPVLLIDYAREPGAGLALHHNLVRIEAGATLTLIEAGAVGQHINRVLEVEVADGGTFNHIQVHDFTDLESGITNIFAHLGAGATFKSFTIATGQSLCRNESFVTLAGAGGRAHVAGAAVGGAGFHHDDTVFVTHAAPECESRQVFKKVLNGGAVGVFQGKILVKPDAQKTDGYQLSQALLADESSQFLAKPELEIYADDVACSHGSTCGSLDPDSLFYLRSRGVPLAEARDILALGFLNEALQEVDNDAMAGILNTILACWLVRSRA